MFFNRLQNGFLFFAFYLSWNFVSAQEIYQPDSVVTICEERTIELKKQFDKNVLSITAKNKDEKDYIKSRYEARYDYLKYSIEGGMFLINSGFEKHVQDLIKIITDANPELKPSYTVYISRSAEPNAMSLGDGNIVVNIGILDKINSDGELMFILCHELSHDYLDHVKNGILLKAKKYFDKEFQAKLKKTLKEEYNVNKKLKEFIIPELKKDMAYNRSEEAEADSLGLVFYNRTKFSPLQPINAMLLLDKIDDFYEDKKIDYKQTLSFPELPFKDSWLNGSHESSLGEFVTEKDSLEDSLKTHPDTKLRLSILRNQIGLDSLSEGKININDNEFKKINLLAKSELIYSTFMSGDLGRSLYLSTMMKQELPDNTFAKVMLSWGFARLAHLMKNHQMQVEVSLPNENFSADYNSYITFLNEIGMTDVRKLGYLLIQSVDSLYKNSEEYQAAYIMCNYVEKDKTITEQYYNEYKSKFPKGKYVKYFSPLFTTNQKNKK